MRKLSSAFKGFDYNFNTFRGDVFGGVTSAVVGLPVAIAFGIASGLGPLAGLYGAIAVGFFAAVFGGTRSQISGPTGPMSVAMAVIVTANADDLSKAFTIVLMAGAIQILLGVLGVGRFVSFTPYSVISGFMSGIGVIIMVMQTLPFLGTSLAAASPPAVIGRWPDAITNVNLHALAIALITLGVCVAWPARLGRFVPATLLALIVGTLLGLFWLTDAPVIGEVPTGLPDLVLPIFTADAIVSAVQPALAIALLGSIDSLLTSLVADAMTRTRHNANKELIGQGIANMVAGLFRALPGAGATLGTVVNLRAGGRTQVSGVVRAGILLALVLGLGRYVETIPLAVLAGILMKVGWDIVDWRFITRLHLVQREHLIVMVTTMGLTVFVDLVTAVAIGLITAGMASARQFERLELDSVISVPLLDQTFLHEGDPDLDDLAARVGLVALRGSFTVASSIRLVNTLSIDIRDHEVVILDFTDTAFVDDSAALVVEQMIDTAAAEDTDCIVVGLTGQPAQNLHALNVLRRIPEDQYAETLDEAREISRRLLQEPA